MRNEPPGDENDERSKEQFQLSIFEAEPKQANGAPITSAGNDEKENDKRMTIGALYERFFARKAGAWTAIFTFFLVVFSGLLWNVTQNANDASVVTQRAFVSCGSPAITKQIVRDKLTGVNVFSFWVNSGNTPSKSGISQANVYIGTTEPREGLNFDDLPQAEKIQFILGPKGGMQTQPIPVSNDDLESLVAGKKRIFYWGWVTYRDIFPDTPARVTEFCYVFSNANWTKADHSDITSDVTINTPPCPTHNCYDEECKDYKIRTR